MTLQKIGEGYVNPEEISCILKNEQSMGAMTIVSYNVCMKNNDRFAVTEEHFKAYHDRYLRYTESNHSEDDDVF